MSQNKVKTLEKDHITLVNKLSDKNLNEHEIDLQDFIMTGIERTKLASIIYGLSKSKGKGMVYNENKAKAQLIKTSDASPSRNSQTGLKTCFVSASDQGKSLNKSESKMIESKVMNKPIPKMSKSKVLATILTLWLADKSGRRLLLIVSSSAMALSLLVVSISFYLKEYISPDFDLYATLSLVIVIAFSLGLGAMPWIIMSEILPINIKGLAGSFATLANWFFSWLVTLTANLLLDWSSGGTFTIYTAVCVFTVGFVAIWVPETKGKTLEEIQQFFR
ncbi:sugar transporter ERD6-like 6 [Lathyrus oleraceus]|uniref:sugar transporter ERD6-like 6 n=1 Tax=Pisum sativum TaxID=3888 RepID=UPI0021D25C83|nr:sugar transporter ERD6-like 6 [Pisum sativum]